ncbi:MAG: hypothetical protein J5888_01485, partial [Bacteroidaceae bacterium]|nr:hypothetical protein [Bacteroidaceae bacterium]
MGLAEPTAQSEVFKVFFQISTLEFTGEPIFGVVFWGKTHIFAIQMLKNPYFEKKLGVRLYIFRKKG